MVTDSWEDLFAQLVRFKKQHGHCLVPALYADNPKLGRWVAAQRYRRRINALTAEQVRKLEAIGFVWSATDLAWERMFESLKHFIREHGHANVPEHYQQNVQLARWVQTQRHRRWKGRLSPQRIARLDEVGFVWAVYKREGAVRRSKAKGEAPPTEPDNDFQQRLFALGNGTYVQYSGRGRMPPDLEKYVRARRGTYPPFIPLPKGPTWFFIGERYTRETRYAWDGKGRLPERVLKYVSVNGTLPRHEAMPRSRRP